MPFAATWMGLEIVILSGTSQKQEKYHMTLLIWTTFFSFLIYLTALGFSGNVRGFCCYMRDLSLWHVRSSSLTRNQT